MDAVAVNDSSRWSRLVSNKMTLLYTGCIFFNQFSYGLGTNIVGPSLIDLQHIYRCSIQEISLVATFLATGYLLGALVPLIMARLNRQLTIVCLLIIQSATLAMMPHCYRVNRLYLVAIAYGFGGGGWDSSNTIWLVEMWPTTSAPFLQACQFAFGLGMIAGPLIVSPFVVGEGDNSTSTVTPDQRREWLTYPFGIASLVQLVVPLILILNYAIKPYQGPAEGAYRVDSTESDEDCNDRDYNDEEMIITGAYQAGNANRRNSRAPNLIYRRDSTYSSSSTSDLIGLLAPEVFIPWRTAKLILAAVAIGVYGGFENSLWSFFSSVLQWLPVALSAVEAARVLSLIAVTYSFGRLLAAVLLGLFHITPDTLLTVHYSFILLSLGLVYVGRNSRNVLYYGSALLGLAFSAIWSAIFSFTEHHIGLSDPICSLFSFLSGLSTLLLPIILGEMLKSHPIVLFYMLGTLALISALSFLVLRVLVIIKPRRRRSTSD